MRRVASAGRWRGGCRVVRCGVPPASVHRAPSVIAGLCLVLVPVLAPAARASDAVRLECTPRTVRVVPGEPIQLRLTAQSTAARSWRWQIPDEPRLKLRAVEELPARRTREGVFVYERVVVWQGLEPGRIQLKTLAVQTKEQKLVFPEVTIIICDPAP